MSAPSQDAGLLPLQAAPTCETSMVQGAYALDPTGVAVGREVEVARGRAVGEVVAVGRAVGRDVAVLRPEVVAVARVVLVAVAVRVAVAVAVALPPLHVPLFVHQLSVLGLNGELGGQSRLPGIDAIDVYFVLL